MAGIYIHIPFCKKKCIYCAFYSIPGTEQKNAYIKALCKEIESRKDYLDGNKPQTIYIGGGTPSLLDAKELSLIVRTLDHNFDLSLLKEFTIEINPDDSSADYLKALKDLGADRLSFGVQSFSDDDLRILNRRHTAAQAQKAIEEAYAVGYDNVSLDLMYGLPDQTLQQWHENVRRALSLGIQHISAYSLTYEEGTLLTKMKENKKVAEANEELSRKMYFDLKTMLEKNGIFQYEISNFARKGFESKHNSSYWDETHYVGFGPSAHSYDGSSRQWNVSNLEQYINTLKSGTDGLFEREVLSMDDMYEDMLLTALRTMRGLDLRRLGQLSEELRSMCLRNARPLIASNLLRIEGDRLILTEDGLFVSDYIIGRLA